MSIRVTVTGDLAQLPSAVEFGRADMMRAAEAARRGMIPLIPIDTGALTRSGRVMGDEVVYDASRGGREPYASYVHDMPQGRVKVGGRYARWPEQYESAGMPEVVEEVARIVESKRV